MHAAAGAGFLGRGVGCCGTCRCSYKLHTYIYVYTYIYIYIHINIHHDCIYR